MNVPKELLYSVTHEWVRVEGNKAYLGLTDYAQDKLGQIVFVELPDLEQEISEKEQVAVVESVKAVSEFYSPVSGKVSEINEMLLDNPEQINEDPYGSWFLSLEMSDTGELDRLLTAEQYATHLENEEEH